MKTDMLLSGFGGVPTTSANEEVGALSPDAARAHVVRFICGMSRAGTEWVCRCLNERPDVAAFGESQFFARYFVAPNSSGTYSPDQLQRVVYLLKHRKLTSTMGGGPGSLKDFNHRKQVEAIDRAFRDIQRPVGPAEVFLRASQAIAQAAGKTIPVEKTPQHVNWIGRIVREFPAARMVILVRDPYSFMLSYKHQGDRKPEKVRRAFRRRYHPCACAYIWRSYYRAALTAIQKYPENVLIARFEDLRQDPERELQTIQSFLGLEPLEIARLVPPVNSSFPDGPRPQLSSDDIFWMNTIARREIVQYRGSFTRGRTQVLQIGASVLHLPLWTISNVMDLYRRLGKSVWPYLWRWLRPAAT